MAVTIGIILLGVASSILQTMQLNSKIEKAVRKRDEKKTDDE